MTTEPGWYEDSHGIVRWWDGTSWTTHVLPVDYADDPNFSGEASESDLAADDTDEPDQLSRQAAEVPGPGESGPEQDLSADSDEGADGDPDGEAVRAAQGSLGPELPDDAEGGRTGDLVAEQTSESAPQDESEPASERYEDIASTPDDESEPAPEDDSEPDEDVEPVTEDESDPTLEEASEPDDEVFEPTPEDESKPDGEVEGESPAELEGGTSEAGEDDPQPPPVPLQVAAAIAAAESGVPISVVQEDSEASVSLPDHSGDQHATGSSATSDAAPQRAAGTKKWLPWVIGAAGLLIATIAVAMVSLNGQQRTADSEENQQLAEQAVQDFSKAWLTSTCELYTGATTDYYRENLSFADCGTFVPASEAYSNAVRDYELSVESVEYQQVNGAPAYVIETTETYMVLKDAAGALLESPEAKEDRLAYTVIPTDHGWQIENISAAGG